MVTLLATLVGKARLHKYEDVGADTNFLRSETMALHRVIGHVADPVERAKLAEPDECVGIFHGVLHSRLCVAMR